jgi:2-polyprenyl-6-methoxyphenol hydroxylase-like FAD-dependent oxidoreductase
MSRRVFDVVVVGGELSGLAAAALLAHAGKRVALVEEGTPLVSLLGDRLCPCAPSLWRMPPMGPVAAFFDALGLKSDARRIFGEPVGIGVVDDDDLRLVVPVADEARRRELGRCFGGVQGQALADALVRFDPHARDAFVGEAASLHEDGWWFEARRARRRVEALGPRGRLDDDDDDVRELWGTGDGLAPVLGQLQPFLQSRQSTGVRGFAAFQSAVQLAAGVSVSLPLGPRPALHDLLRRFVLQHGGESLADRVDTVTTEGARVALLVTAEQRWELAAQVVIDATGARDLSTRMQASRRQSKLVAQQDRVPETARACAVRWLLPLQALPRGMPPVLVDLAGGQEPILVAVYAGAPPAGAGKSSAMNDRLVAVVAAAATEDPQRVAATLERLMPFARPRVHSSDVVDATPFHGRYGVRDAQHPLGGRRPRTPFRNLFRAGRDLVPALGIDGELLAARSVATLVERALPPPQKT